MSVLPRAELEPMVRRCPKVLLHDHLTGGVRATTLAELRGASGDAPARPLVGRDDRKSLASYLAGFSETIAALQSPEALERVAREAVQDLARDGVVYAEIRLAPEQHVAGGMSIADALRAAARGLREECAALEAGGGPVSIRLVAAVRRDLPFGSVVVDEAITAWRNGDVVGLDLVGPEDGYPARLHRDSFARARAAGLPICVHAGEASGLESVEEALFDLHASRLGHAVALGHEIVESGLTSRAAEFVARAGVMIECCPTSNVDTGAVATLEEHPWTRLLSAGIPISINTDNRTMSDTSMTKELVNLVAAGMVSASDVPVLMREAAQAAFRPDEALGLLSGTPHLLTERHEPGVDRDDSPGSRAEGRA